MPDGTPIPPSGIECAVGDEDLVLYRTIISVTREGAFIDDNGHLWCRAEAIKHPCMVPLTMDDYHGEPIRFSRTCCSVAMRWDSHGIQFADRAQSLWEVLAETAEYYKDNAWQPMRKVKA
jgi:hypothetical protein